MRGGREGAGAPERQLSHFSRQKVTVLGPDWKWWQQRERVCFCIYSEDRGTDGCGIWEKEESRSKVFIVKFPSSGF